MSKGLFAKNSQGKKIVTCHSCGFQTTWGNYVDWDSKFECRNCSPTKQDRMINKSFVQVGTSTSRFSCKEPNVSNSPKHSSAVKQTTDFANAKDVHTEHCCSLHGCKYGESDCPVEFGNKQQSYPCWYCNEAVGSDEPYWVTSGWSIWKVDKGKEKKELLDKIRQFLWMVEHTDTLFYNQVIDNLYNGIETAHRLRVEFDKVFGEEYGK